MNTIAAALPRFLAALPKTEISLPYNSFQ